MSYSIVPESEATMSDSEKWKRIWDNNAKEGVADFELDRGISPRDLRTEQLSEAELVGFIEPQANETLLDAGCGTGINIVRLHSRVRSVIGIDYTEGSVERCRRRVQKQNIENAQLYVGSISEIPLPDRSVDKIICLSVLQYLDDNEVRQVLRQFARVLVSGGAVILHVKNRSSLYWATLLTAKRILTLLGKKKNTYNVRPFRWYTRELAAAGFDIVTFNGCNVVTLEAMPRALVSFLQGFELRYFQSWLLRNSFVRSHGADLKIKARKN